MSSDSTSILLQQSPYCNPMRSHLLNSNCSYDKQNSNNCIDTLLKDECSLRAHTNKSRSEYEFPPLYRAKNEQVKIGSSVYLNESSVKRPSHSVRFELNGGENSTATTHSNLTRVSPINSLLSLNIEQNLFNNQNAK